MPHVSPYIDSHNEQVNQKFHPISARPSRPAYPTFRPRPQPSPGTGPAHDSATRSSRTPSAHGTRVSRPKCQKSAFSQPNIQTSFIFSGPPPPHMYGPGGPMRGGPPPGGPLPPMGPGGRPPWPPTSAPVRPLDYPMYARAHIGIGMTVLRE